MAVEEKDLSAEALSRVVRQLRGKPSFAALLAVYTAQAADLQTALISMFFLTSIDNSSGANLDVIGDLIGEPRTGRLDADYRLALKARININTSEGTTEDLIEIIAAVLEDPALTIEVTDYEPAAVVVEVHGAVAEDTLADFAALVLASAKAGGVRTHLVTSTEDDATSFMFSETAIETSTTQGFAQTGLDDTLGGVLAREG